MAYFWVANWVCLGYAWVTSWICVALVWIAKTVCLAWTWVSYLVCVAWVWIKYTVCVSWAVIVLTYITLCCAFSKKIVGYFKCLFWTPQDMPPNDIIKSGWILTFEDDFNSGAIDYTKWIDHISFLAPTRYSYDLSTLTGADFANGKFPNRYWSPKFTFGPSTVKLVADNTPLKVTVTTPEWSGDFWVPYTVQALQWKDKDPLIEQRHGYFEIRCKSQDARDMWPAFWLFGVTPDISVGPPKTWPPELDIFEFMSRVPEIFSTTQHWGQDPGHPSEGKSHRACQAGKYFHIYACEWDEEKISWYLDNQLLRTTTKGVQDFIYPMSVIVNSQVDERECRKPRKSQYPNWLEVDYVRVYKKL